jgi:pimeloyl-ACP methyl ester carboxylesterase
MNSDTLSLRGGRRWQVFSGGTGPTLIWLHGLRGVDPADPTLIALQNNYRVIAPVAPGFNGLDELDRIDNIHELALDYDDLIEHLGVAACTLVGHSFGAMAAAEIAAHFPRRAERLVLLAPFGLWNDAYPVADVFAVPTAQIDDLLWHDAPAREKFAKPLVSVAGLDPAAAKLVAAEAIKLAQGLTAVTKFVWPIPDRGLRRRLSRIACPALTVFGGEDKVVPQRYTEDFKAGLRDGRTAVVARAGHMLTYERPGEVANLIAEFVKAKAKVA